MPIDAQIHPTGTAPAPLDYTVPNAQEILLKAVNADFDGSGAAGDFLPCVTILSDGGVVIARAIGSSVTAGDSAEVSFFPGAVKAASVTPSSTAIAIATGFSDFAKAPFDPAQSVPAASTRNGTFAHVSTTDNTLMDWTTVVFANDTLQIFAAGTVLLFASSLWDTTDVALTTLAQDAGGFGIRHDPDLPTGNPSFVATEGIANSQDWNVLHVPVSGTTVKLLHNNQLGAAHNVDAQYLTAVYLGTA